MTEQTPDPKAPTRFDQRVRVSSPNGDVMETRVEFEDGTTLTNVLRTVISIESPTARGPNGEQPDGKCYAFITQYDAEAGRVVYGVAEALVGNKGAFDG